MSPGLLLLDEPLSALDARVRARLRGEIRSLQRRLKVTTLAGSIGQSLWIAGLSTVICVGLAFVYAYGLTRTCMLAHGLFHAIAQVPILAPSLLPAISLVHLFCNQGLAKGALMGASI